MENTLTQKNRQIRGHDIGRQKGKDVERKE
jgi:hypothetical protein